MRCICKKCHAVCAAVISTSSTWEVTIWKNGADAPCNSSASSSIPRCALLPDVLPAPVIAASLPDPLIAAAPEPVACSICSGSFPHHEMFECPNPAAHLLCQECFENNIASQICEDLMDFTNRGCAILCAFCNCEATKSKQGPTLPFNMQLLSPR